MFSVLPFQKTRSGRKSELACGRLLWTAQRLIEKWGSGRWGGTMETGELRTCYTGPRRSVQKEGAPRHTARSDEKLLTAGMHHRTEDTERTSPS